MEFMDFTAGQSKKQRAGCVCFTWNGHNSANVRPGCAATCQAGNSQNAQANLNLARRG